jgi:hypothetical protein
MISVFLWWLAGPGKLDKEEVSSNPYLKKKLTKKFFTLLPLTIIIDMFIGYVLLSL